MRRDGFPAAWVYSTPDAVELYRDIMAGPTADIDKALAAAKKGDH